MYARETGFGWSGWWWLLLAVMCTGVASAGWAQSVPCECPGGTSSGCEQAIVEEQGMFIPDEGVIVELGRMAVVCARAEYETGCDSGDYDACADFGLLLWDDRESNASVMYAYLLDGCNRAGRMDACLTAAMATEQGRGVTADAERALQLYQRLCEQEYAAGCAEVARVEEARQAEEARQRNPFYRAGVTLPEFVLIPSGTFTMGSPLSESGRGSDETQHSVTLTQGFYIQTTEVTQGQWQALMGNNPSYFSSCGDSCPVDRVSWFDAVAFANARSRAEGLSECYELSGCSGIPGSGTVTGDGAPRYGVGDYACATVRFVGLSCAGYRLPTEAEWEYAARAGTTGPAYVSGTVHSSTPCAADAALARIAWFDATALVTYASDSVITACDQQLRGPHGVGLLQANAWGLYDMLGNVWEWTNDWYGSEYGTGAVTDPVGPSGGSGRVNRGGGWGYHAAYVRAANRSYDDPGYRYNDLGFRLARSAR
ncbi:MAG: SUMF1/EgtB/PvdO family nonheme iron enzyme [Myxococcales bacterium]|nr:SUMF1/EgtB/PvdO family nonheme iron enzyme [Myxococcales bacterium]